MFPQQLSSGQIAPHRLNAIHLFCRGAVMHVDNPFNCIHILGDGKRCTQPIGKKRRKNAVWRNFDISRRSLERLEWYIREGKEDKIINRILTCVFCSWHDNERTTHNVAQHRERCRVWLRQEIVRMRAAATASGGSSVGGDANGEDDVDFENGLSHPGNSAADNPFQITIEDAWRNYNRKWHDIEVWIHSTTRLSGETTWQRLPQFLTAHGDHNIMHSIPWPTMNASFFSFTPEATRNFYERSIFFTKFSVADQIEQERMSPEDIDHAREVIHQETGRWLPLVSSIEEIAGHSLMYLVTEHQHETAKNILEVLKILEAMRNRVTQPILQMEIVDGEPIEIPVYDFTDMWSALNDMTSDTAMMGQQHG